MKTFITTILFCLFSLPLLVGQNNVEFSASANWISYMNVSRANGEFWFGDPWSVAALKTTISTGANTMTLQPNFNTYADNPTNPEWVDQTTGEGVAIMEASTFVEPGASFNGQDLTFSGTVQSYTIDDAYTVRFFIKALDPDAGYSDALGGTKVFELPTSGDFTVSATGAELAPGLLIQYGFSVTGRNANPANEAALGSVVITGEGSSSGSNNILCNASDSWGSFMNVFRANGDYWFGDVWSVADLKTTLDVSANNIILQPNFNTYAANSTDPEWVDQTTGEGVAIMEANTILEPGATFNGSDLTFSGTVDAYTLDDAYTVKFFIKALDPNNGFSDALGGSKVLDLPASGAFTVSATGAELAPGLVIQCGFSVTGRNANPANEAALGSVIIGPGTVSVNDLNNLAIAMSVFPNPTSETLFIKSDAQVQSYQIVTLLGQTVQRGNATKEIDVKNLAAGTYFLAVQAAEGNKVMKFIKN
jgi:hypothetical protein